MRASDVERLLLQMILDTPITPAPLSGAVPPTAEKRQGLVGYVRDVEPARGFPPNPEGRDG